MPRPKPPAKNSLAREGKKVIGFGLVLLDCSTFPSHQITHSERITLRTIPQTKQSHTRPLQTFLLANQPREEVRGNASSEPHRLFKVIFRASLVAQRLRICLPMQGTRVRALVWEDPTCRGATRPVSHNY